MKNRETVEMYRKEKNIIPTKRRRTHDLKENWKMKPFEYNEMKTYE